MTDDDAWAPAAPERQALGADLGLPGYTGFEEIARGGDSIVYRARQEALNRDVAVKVVLAEDPATAARFQRELEITVRLGRQHPHIVSVLDTGTTPDGNPCLVMEFHDLGSLHDRVAAHGQLPVSDVVAAGTAVADALAFAHGHGVLHRDVKPQNVLLLPTSYVLTDFGIARMADAGHTASLERFSYRHASPQVLDGLEPAVADDVWSLGSTLFTLLDGRAPFATPDPAEDTALGYLRRVRTHERRILSREDVPPELLAVVDRCLAPGREDRFATADEVRDALRAVPTESRSWAPGPAAVPGTPTAASAPSPGVAAPTTTAPGPVPEATAPDTPDEVPVGASGAGEASSPAEPETRAVPSLTLPPAQPVEPSAVAPSALAMLSAPGAVGTGTPAAPAGRAGLSGALPGTAASASSLSHPEAAPTGLHPDAQSVGTDADGSSDQDDHDGAEAGRRRWPAVVGFVVGALLIGSALGVAVTYLASSQRGAEPDPFEAAPEPTTAPVPTHEGEIPLPTGDLQAEISNPALEPQGLVPLDRGTSVALEWDDPTGGNVWYIVVDVVAHEPGASPVAKEQLAAGVTSFTVEGVDPTLSEVCFQIVAVDVDDFENRGVSDAACVQRP